MQYSDFATWPVREAIELIHSAGGYAVLAHPAGAGDRVMGEPGFLVHVSGIPYIMECDRDEVDKIPGCRFTESNIGLINFRRDKQNIYINY